MTRNPLAVAAAVAISLSSTAGAQVLYASRYPNEAWKVLRNWEDRSTEAGPGWPANSGLNWQQKYSRWIASMRKIPRHDGDRFTFELTTPWGKTLPAPVADCADTAMLLRVLFASWYNLPVVIRAGPYYYGHFGIRSTSGVQKALCSACDYTGRDIARLGWPKHVGLRARRVSTSDTQPHIGDGKGGTGAYLDEVLLNKRAGYVITSLMSNAGSGNLAGSTNLYDIRAEAIQAGDVLIERWQAEGIGHTIVIKTAEPAPGGKIKVEIAAGWLPPRQTLWEGSVDAHAALSDDYMGGSDCAERASDGSCRRTYAEYGGGLKRWRVAKVKGGKWVATIMDSDAQSYIQATQYAELGKRPDIFEDLVHLPRPEELRDEFLRLIEESRASLRRKPSGCAARERREGFFEALHNLMTEEFRVTRAQVDGAYRRTEDFVFAPLDYTKSPTCCWNGATPEMGAAVIATAIARAKQSEQARACVAPAIFGKVNGQYPYSGTGWPAYRNDENCAQGAALNDVAKAWSVTPYCTLKPFLRE